jgi:DHA1 family bicyclomycin/chloramphenicol resistance-like MFS transporter
LDRLRANPRLLAPLLACLAMLAPFAIDTFFPAFPAMQAEFGVGPAAMQQSLSVYLIGYASMSLWHGALSDAFGRRHVILISLGVFALATAGCAMSTTLPQLLVFRFLQGVAGGAGVIVGRAIVRDRYDGMEAMRVMSNVTMIFGLAPALAPIIGGWVLVWGGWRTIFWMLTAFAGALLLVSLFALPETHPHERRAVFSPQLLRRTYVGILSDGHYLLIGFAMALNFAALFTYIASAPTYVFNMLHLGARQFGWLFVPLIGGMIAGARLSGWMAGRALPSRVARLGFFLAGAGAVSNLALSVFMKPMIPWSVLPLMVGAIGVSLAQPTLTLMMLDRFPGARGAAAAMQVTINLVCNAVVSGIIAPIASATPVRLALAAASMSFGALVLWLAYRATSRVRPE